jgi:uncharacterized protein (TIGR03435 family)
MRANGTGRAKLYYGRVLQAISRDAVLKLVCSVVAIVAGLAQLHTKASAAGPTFEVAAIKPCKPQNDDGRKTGGERLSPGGLHLECSTVRDMIYMAYVVFENGHVSPRWSGSVPIKGGEAWINSERYRVDAKPAEPEDQALMHGPMLQTLLEDRLKLKTHRETTEVPAYALTVAKGGLKMHQFKEGSCVPLDFDFIFTQFPPPPIPDPPPGQQYCGGTTADGKHWTGSMTTRKGPNVTIEAHAISLDEFPRVLALDRPLINRTGITGRFDFHLEFAAAETASSAQAGAQAGAPPVGFPDDPTGGASIFTALQEQLGLKLESAKGTGEILVIDHVERPSEN